MANQTYMPSDYGDYFLCMRCNERVKTAAGARKHNKTNCALWAPAVEGTR